MGAALTSKEAIISRTSDMRPSILAGRDVKGGKLRRAVAMVPIGQHFGRGWWVGLLEDFQLRRNEYTIGKGTGVETFDHTDSFWATGRPNILVYAQDYDKYDSAIQQDLKEAVMEGFISGLERLGLADNSFGPWDTLREFIQDMHSRGVGYDTVYKIQFKDYVLLKHIDQMDPGRS